MLEESWAYQYKENKKAQRGGGRRGGDGPVSGGLRPEFEEDFEFGGDDPNDYTDKAGLIALWEQERIRRELA